MADLIGKNTISGREAVATIKIGEDVETLFYAKKIEAKFQKEKVDVKTLGNRAVQSKTVGWKGTGTMTLYYVSSKFRQMAIDYISTGKDLYCTLIVTNNDPGSQAGAQEVTLSNVNLDSTILAMFNVDSTVLEEEVTFTFDNAAMGSKFTQL